MNNIFTNWLASENKSPLFLKENSYKYIILKLEKNKDFDYLYCQKRWNNSSAAYREPFIYVGIYCKRNNLLYDVPYEFRDLVPESENIASKNVLLNQMEKIVRCKVENIINNDRHNLEITQLTDKSLLEDLEMFYTYYSKREARNYFLNNEELEPMVFQCSYTSKAWTENGLLEYILDSDGYAQKEAMSYIRENQQEILYSFLCNDAIQKEYEVIQKDIKNPVHTIKKIMATMKTTSAKTVKVTIHKDDVEFTFKTKTDDLCRDCIYNYSTWDIIAADRHRFEQTFGRQANYKPQEILRITHGKKVLYEASKQ